jgi:hypothetical protein
VMARPRMMVMMVMKLGMRRLRPRMSVSSVRMRSVGVMHGTMPDSTSSTLNLKLNKSAQVRISCFKDDSKINLPRQEEQKQRKFEREQRQKQQRPTSFCNGVINDMICR